MKLPFFTRQQPVEQKSISDPESWLFDLFGASGPTNAGISVSAESALKVPAVASAVRTISEAAACLDIRVVEIAEDRTETVVEHPVTSLIADEANDWTSGYELIRGLVVDALCRDRGGTAFVNWVNDEPTEIIRYRPGVIDVDLTQDTGEPIYRINGRTIDSQNIIHVRGPYDKAPLSLAREAIGVALVMEQHAARLFGSGARPGGVIQSPKPIGDDGVKAMLKGWKAANEGADKAGKTAILWDGATWNPMALNSVDSQFQQLRLFQLQECARAFNIPASMLGDLSRATWSNAAEMERQFLLLCLEPWLKAVEAALRRALFQPEDRKRFAIRFDRDDFSNVDLAARATAINSLIAARVINPNEGRAWLGGLAPYPDGNQFANPNTGASQPNAAKPGGDPEKDELKRRLQEIEDQNAT